MAARYQERGLSAGGVAEDVAALSIGGEEDEEGVMVPEGGGDADASIMLKPAAIDAHLSRQRASAANFKRLAAESVQTYRRVTISNAHASGTTTTTSPSSSPSPSHSPSTPSFSAPAAAAASHTPPPLSREEAASCARLRDAVALRDKWVYRRREPEWVSCPPPRHSDYTVFVPPPYHPFDQQLPPPSGHVCQWQDGIVRVFRDHKSVMRRRQHFDTPALSDFAHDLAALLAIMNDPECRSFSYRRLVLLQRLFDMYVVLNESNERMAQICVPHRDFYNVRKVDVHVHHSSLANQKHLLRFIKRKVRENGDDLVWRDKKNPSAPPLTLTQVFESLDLQPHELSVDTLDVHADSSLFHRFDRFNLKYNPFGQSRLREIFMKTDNFTGGRFLAELTHEVLDELQDTKYQNSEYRVSIYGRAPDEWDKLSAWFVDHKIYSDNVRWLIQIPRLYSTYRENKTVGSFQDMLDNIFSPLFEATVDPPAHPKLWRLLQQVVGFDSVDDESQPQVRTNLSKCASPEQWDGVENPPYSYYAFYIYANLRVLNQLRESRGMNTFTYRPHAGEAGDVEHLAAAFLLAHGINHGLNLKKSPVLQYLFYLTQVGVAMSPLSNNALFCEYTKNPLPVYFRRGLNVTLSTDDPLQFAFTREPLVEEYSVAAQVWKLSSTDLCELARNSVLQSGFEACIKAHWLGDKWFRHGEEGNDISKTNVPAIRMRFRQDTLTDELRLIYEGRVPQEVAALPTYVFRPVEQAAGAADSMANGMEGVGRSSSSSSSSSSGSGSGSNGCNGVGAANGNGE